MGVKTERMVGRACSPPPSSTPPTTATMAIASPCAACKILRRRCADNCVLAPYFPPTDPIKFTTAHRVFGASNVIKLLQELPESQRADAVSSMVYEANARIRDPVYGCAGAIYQLQKQVSDLQAQLAKAQAEALKLRCHQAHLMAQLSKTTQSSSLSANSSPPWSPSSGSSSPEIDAFFHYSNNNSNYINPTAVAGCYLENDNSLLSLSWENLDSIIL